MEFLPADGRVLLKELDSDFKKKLMGGSSVIELPNTVNSEYLPGEVVSIGECQTIPGGIKYAPKFEVGDIVLFSKSMAQALMLHGKNYIVIDYPYIGGVIR